MVLKLRHGRFAAALAFIGALAPIPGSTSPYAQAKNEFVYITMSDGVKLATAVQYPVGFDPDDAAERWPAIFMMDGYEGAALPILADYGGAYVTVHTSIRGTGCSGGRFDLFDYRQAEDGYEVIESWIVKQPWSNRRVGIVGHSYYGLTGFLVAATNPPDLKAVAISGLIDDLYRGMVYMGGIPNVGFPLIWTEAFRPAISEVQSAQLYGSRLAAGDPVCSANIATRPPPHATDDPLLNGISQREDGPWWRGHSLISRAGGVRAPIHVTQQYQDEQTLGRGGPMLWQHIPTGVPKRLLLTNGVHNTAHNEIFHRDRRTWLDCWILKDGSGCGDVTDPQKRVLAFFETRRGPSDPVGRLPSAVNEPLVSSDFPLPETSWTRLYLRGDGALSDAEPVAPDPRRTYVSSLEDRGSWVHPVTTLGYVAPLDTLDQTQGPVTTTDGPDSLVYVRDFDAPTAIAGPVVADLWLATTGADTDVFLQLVDRAPDGSRSYLQYGMLRGSFAAVDEFRSDRIASGERAGEIWRPYHPFTNPTPVTPGTPVKLSVEVFPLGHVFRRGHSLLVEVSAPPAWHMYNGYESGLASVNAILSEPDHLSSILLPVLKVQPIVPVAEPGCGAQAGIRCVEPVAEP
ncbi:MAG: CocE/NonD family hydrolase [Acidobacteria bacterium]|nr:CocE/NonD family hydrolase [Acidobacteriota bacterium]